MIALVTLFPLFAHPDAHPALGDHRQREKHYLLEEVSSDNYTVDILLIRHTRFFCAGGVALSNVDFTAVATLLCRTIVGCFFFASGVCGWYYLITGREIAPDRVSKAAADLVHALKEARPFWAFMKGLDMMAGAMLVANVLPAFALLLLLPVTTVICLVQFILNPRLGWPIGVALLVPTLWLLAAYSPHYAPLFSLRTQSAIYNSI